MLTADPAALFPRCPAFGFTAAPAYLVKKIMREGGFERRNRKWQRPLNAYASFPTGNRPEADIEEVLHFWHAMGGEEQCFRFKDWVDFKSCALGATPAATDQPLVHVTDSPDHYQLTKQYVVGSRIQVRDITRPRGSTILVANEVGAVQAADRWHLDESTGHLTTLGGFIGVPTAWGGEFDVWVRFDGQLQVQIVEYKAQAASFSLIERRDDNGNA